MSLPSNYYEGGRHWPTSSRSSSERRLSTPPAPPPKPSYPKMKQSDEYKKRVAIIGTNVDMDAQHGHTNQPAAQKVLEQFFPARYEELLALIVSINYSYQSLGDERLTYHNVDHVYSIIALIGRIWNNPLVPARNLSIEKARTLILVAIVHDVGHSHGKYRDNVNIARALSECVPCGEGVMPSLPKFLSRPSGANFHMGLTDRPGEDGMKELLGDIISTVVDSEYPYKWSPDNTVNELSGLFRDVDRLAGMLSPNWFVQIYTGLFNEINLYPQDKLPFDVFCQNQVRFFDSFECYDPFIKRWLITAERNGVTPLAQIMDRNSLVTRALEEHCDKPEAAAESQ